MPRRMITVLSLALATGFIAAPVMAQFGGGGYATPKVAHFELRGPLIERPMGEMAFNLFGGPAPLSLKELVERMKQARDDSDVKAIVITMENVQMGLAQIQEVRQAMQQVRAADKEVYVHADSLGLGTYALACAASRISVVPTGDLWLLGLYGETPYLKGLLDKIGVNADFVHIGAYKSAAEPLTRTGPSEESQEMTNWLLDSIYDTLLKMIADSRQMGKTKVQDIIDKGPYLAEDALEVGLIDAVEYRDDFVSMLKKRYGSNVRFPKNYGADKEPGLGLDSSNPLVLFQEISKLFSGGESQPSTPGIGVVYVEGAISTGSEEVSPFGGSSGAKSTSIAKALNDAADDASIKAVVLRVDSPGGSALASEIIWNATQRVKMRKPLVVSMGNVAGSGGYYVSCGADAIFADASTITASIGVVGGKLVTTEMWNKIGINWDAHQRGENAGMMSSAEPFNDYERQRILDYMNDIYLVFKKRITDARGDKLTKPLDDMAGGRVYTGTQALELGLVDKLGGLYEAVRHAAGLAQVGDYEVRVIPAPKTIFDMLRESFGGSESDDDTIHMDLSFLPQGSPLLDQLVPMLKELDPERMHAVMQVLTTLEMIHTDGVALMMEPLVIRNVY